MPTTLSAMDLYREWYIAGCKFDDFVASDETHILNVMTIDHDYLMAYLLEARADRGSGRVDWILCFQAHVGPDDAEVEWTERVQESAFAGRSPDLVQSIKNYKDAETYAMHRLIDWHWECMDRYHERMRKR